MDFAQREKQFKQALKKSKIHESPLFDTSAKKSGEESRNAGTRRNHGSFINSEEVAYLTECSDLDKMF